MDDQALPTISTLTEFLVSDATYTEFYQALAPTSRTCTRTSTRSSTRTRSASMQVDACKVEENSHNTGITSAKTEQAPPTPMSDITNANSAATASSGKRRKTVKINPIVLQPDKVN